MPSSNTVLIGRLMRLWNEAMGVPSAAEAEFRQWAAGAQIEFDDDYSEPQHVKRWAVTGIHVPGVLLEWFTPRQLTRVIRRRLPCKRGWRVLTLRPGRQFPEPDTTNVPY